MVYIIAFHKCEKDEDCLEICADDEMAMCILNVCFCY